MNVQILSSLMLGSAILANAQGTFQNLNFESANLSPVPSGQFGSFVSISDALPGWTGYLGSEQVTQVLQNNLTLGNASIDILGPNWSYNGIIEGQYMVVLQPGLDPFGSGQNVSASISQTSLVPANALSLQFKAETPLFSAWSVSLGGDNLSVIPLGTGANYTLYGANIPSSDAGQAETLTITALAAGNTAESFDSFVFLPSPLPEPNPLVLTCIGWLLVASYCRYAAK